MPVTREELRDFTNFADQKLSNGGANSLVELASEWEVHRREMDETVSDIRKSHADIDAGRVKTVAEAFANVRKQLGVG